jgi:maltose alpha-D-glucosyltransferase / alpha-amylase
MPVSAKATSDLWWKNAIMYCVDVKAFQDSGGDGIGDFDGLTRRVDYLAALGINCLWLLPFFTSPWRDNGYDVADYYNVDPRLGTLGDLVEFLRTARDRGIKVITDLVVNHTSDEHPWFRAARESRDSPYRDFYVWRDEPEAQPKGLVFPGEEDSNWQLDERTGQYYLHRFYKFQPDLNVENPAVWDEISKIIGFWLELGLAGFRIDAAPFLLETDGIPGKSPDDPHAPLRALRAFLSRRKGDAILLGEANLPADQLLAYFGEHGDELHMLFNFLLNQWLHLAFVRHDAGPVRDHLRDLPVTPIENHFATFIRNSDELSLDKLSDAEREEVFVAFAPDEGMRIYDRGIRRRLATMVDGDQRRLELAYSLLFTLPGTPVLLYGEEIGMGEDLSVPGRASVRTAMQWTAKEANGGFSTADPSTWPTPVVSGGRFGWQRRNVADQRRDPGSLYNRVARMIRVHKECPEFGFGAWRLVETGDPAVLGLEFDRPQGPTVTLHNFAAEQRQVTLDLPAGTTIEEVQAAGDEKPVEPDDPTVPLGPYGWRWLRLWPA